MTHIPTIASYSLPTTGDLPGNVAKWNADPSRAVFLIHDMQRYFVRFLDARIRAQLINNAARLRRRGVEMGVQIAYSAQPGGMSEEQRGLLKDFWGPGMQVEANDRDIVDELTPDRNDWIFTKWRYSAFFHSDLLNRMRETGRDQLIIGGIYAHVGVLMTAIDAFTNDIQPFLVADATADFSEKHHRLALEYAAQRCAFVSTWEEVLP